MDATPCDVSPRPDSLFGPYVIVWERVAGVATFWVVYAASGRNVFGVRRIFRSATEIPEAIAAHERKRCPVCGRGIDQIPFTGYCPACGREDL